MDNYSNVEFLSEFKNYAIKHMGISGMQFYSWEKLQNSLYGNPQVLSTPTNSLTPYIIEERQMNVTQMDIFSRLMMDRILWLAGPVNDQMSTIVQAQLMFLDNVDSNKDITMHIDTPGGSVKSGLSIVDTMNYITPDIVTVNTGMSASMGSVLLGAGTKGKRFSLPFSRVMLHQVSYGASGNVQDVAITVNEANKTNNELFELLGSYTGKDPEVVKADAQRDLWLTSNEAVEYGIIDSIIRNKKN